MKNATNNNYVCAIDTVSKPYILFIGEEIGSRTVFINAISGEHAVSIFSKLSGLTENQVEKIEHGEVHVKYNEAECRLVCYVIDYDGSETIIKTYDGELAKSIYNELGG